PPFGTQLYINSTGCRDSTTSCTDEMVGSAGSAGIPTTTSTTLPAVVKAQFSEPSGVAIDSTGNMYVADFGECRVQKFDASGTFATAWGSRGAGPGEFVAPSGVATDGNGNVYVADTGNARIQKFDADGRFLTAWSSGEFGDAEILNPLGIATDPSANVFVS